MGSCNFLLCLLEPGTSVCHSNSDSGKLITNGDVQSINKSIFVYWGMIKCRPTTWRKEKIK